jgi:hypothetical protein
MQSDKGTEEHYAKETDLPLQHLLESSLIFLSIRCPKNLISSLQKLHLAAFIEKLALFDWTQFN